MYICNNQIDMTYNVYLNNNKNINYQYKWIWVKIDYIFLTQVKKGRWASEAQVGPLCEDKILAVWVLTHCGPVTPYGNIDLGRHLLR